MDSVQKYRQDVLSALQPNIDPSMLLGVLSFAHGRLTVLVLENPTAITLLDSIWMEIHHPAIKHFQRLFHSKSRSGHNHRPTVELRRLFDNFVKFITRTYEFYFGILKSILNSYDLSCYTPVKKVCATLKTENAKGKQKLSEKEVSTYVYLIHKCVLFIGDLSRYRTLTAKTYLPSTSISKQDNNNYSKSIELYKLALLILPSLGDPYNHIAIIDNSKDDKFNVVYNFIRASMTSTPLPIAYQNLINLLIKNPKHNSMLKKFIICNNYDRVNITKNDRLELLKSQFLILFNTHILPSKWMSKPNKLISGEDLTVIENDFYLLISQLDFHKQIFNDFYFKQLVILIGGFELLIDKATSNSNSLLESSHEILETYMKFIFRYLDIFLKIILNTWDKSQIKLNDIKLSFSTSLLPSLRLIVCWLDSRALPLAYLNQMNDTKILFCEIYNKILLLFEVNKFNISEIYEYVGLGLETNDFNNDEIIKKIISNKPTRARLFKEDITLREFKPVGFVLGDFNDDTLYEKTEDAVLALIGEINKSNEEEIISIPLESKDGLKIKTNDNLLRLLAIAVSIKKIIGGGEGPYQISQSISLEINVRGTNNKKINVSNNNGGITNSNKSSKSDNSSNGYGYVNANTNTNANANNGNKKRKAKKKGLTIDQRKFKSKGVESVAISSSVSGSGSGDDSGSGNGGGNGSGQGNGNSNDKNAYAGGSFNVEPQLKPWRRDKMVEMVERLVEDIPLSTSGSNNSIRDTLTVDSNVSADKITRNNLPERMSQQPPPPPQQQQQQQQYQQFHHQQMNNVFMNQLNGPNGLSGQTMPIYPNQMNYNIEMLQRQLINPQMNPYYYQTGIWSNTSSQLAMPHPQTHAHAHHHEQHQPQQPPFSHQQLSYDDLNAQFSNLMNKK
ncbi:Ebs1 protein [Martiniozyma asiatica (nom. inval.)]|nr:Ebs1 protein [Martiniozyma asiatica]